MSATPLPQNSALFKAQMLVVVVVPLVATALGVKLLWAHAVRWPDLALLAIFYLMTGMGTTVGYHRMLTHRSFDAHPAVKLALLALGAMAMQGNPIEWAAVHIKHHSLSDREGDPHSPIEGLFHAHLGWLFGAGIHSADPQIYCRRLLGDPVVMFVVRTSRVWVGLGLAIPLLVGGWTGLLWGGLVRIALHQHVTWSVNSVCHSFGKREFATNDQSHNEWIVGLLSFGEGWHNNHHAFPRSAFHGFHWWQFDFCGYLIWLLERLGLARDVYRVPVPRQKARAARLAAAQTRTEGP